MHTHTHLQKTHSCMYPRTHKHTWLHNNTPYFPLNLKKPILPLDILLPIYTCTRISHTHACWILPGYWKEEGWCSLVTTGHVPWQLHPACEPVRDTCSTLTQWQRSHWSDPIKKWGFHICLPWQPSWQVWLKEAPEEPRRTCISVLHIIVTQTACCSFPVKSYLDMITTTNV